MIRDKPLPEPLCTLWSFLSRGVPLRKRADNGMMTRLMLESLVPGYPAIIVRLGLTLTETKGALCDS